MCNSRTSDKTLCKPYQLSSSLVRGHFTQTPPISSDDLEDLWRDTACHVDPEQVSAGEVLSYLVHTRNTRARRSIPEGALPCYLAIE